MNLKEYQSKARSTAIYLDIENSQMIYPALGLIGECGEVAGKVKKLIRDSGWNMNQERKDAIIKELGDCCWYLANICCDTNLDLDMMYKMRGCMMQSIKPLPLPRLIFHMNAHAMAVAIELEHWYYDHNCDLNRYGCHTQLTIGISHVIACIEEIAKRCNSTLEEVCVINIEKLTSRQKRGKIRGSGDDR